MVYIVTNYYDIIIIYLLCFYKKFRHVIYLNSILCLHYSKLWSF